MYLEWLRIGHVRNLDQASIEPGPGLNIFTGRNASGKTAILESLYLLARARSFRTPRISEVINRERQSLTVTAALTYQSSGIRATTGIEKAHGNVSIRYNGSPVRTVSEQARQVPLVLVTPDSHRLVTGTPRQRRHWLDWAMFHVEPSYLRSWRDYFRALRHRNSLLKSGLRDAGAYRGWEHTMAEAGERLTNLRQGFVDELEAALEEHPASVLETPPADLSLEPGWPRGEFQLGGFLSSCRDRDLAAGFTRQGPHRADLQFYSQGSPVAALFSRGQIKLFVCRLIMAEARVLEQQAGEAPLFLLDDYTAELDSRASESLLTGLRDRQWQCFLNATDFREEGLFDGGFRRFHVEHGQAAKVVE